MHLEIGCEINWRKVPVTASNQIKTDFDRNQKNNLKQENFEAIMDFFNSIPTHMVN